MDKKTKFLILFVFINTILTTLVLGAARLPRVPNEVKGNYEGWYGGQGTTSKASAVRHPLSDSTKRILVLPDGYMLSGIDGKLTEPDSNDTRFFECKLDVTYSTGRASTRLGEAPSRSRIGAKLELLPSSALESMIADANASSSTDYRLWARVTKYKGRNFIFPTQFLPLSEAKETPPATSQPSQPETQPAQQEVEEPNSLRDALQHDELGIPKEILDKLKTGTGSSSTGREQPERLIRAITGRPTQAKQNFMLVNRVGFLIKQADGDMVFSLDAFGLSAGSTGGTIRLLPCQALEVAEQKQTFAPGMLRFIIAGVVTEYKGKQFLLLHRAIRAYNHGNFGL
jgi:hypothetical protein